MDEKHTDLVWAKAKLRLLIARLLLKLQRGEVIPNDPRRR